MACILKCATSRPTSTTNHLSSTQHLPLRRISSGLSLNAQREWKVTLSCPVTALRSGKEPPSIFGHKSTKSCSKSDTWVGRGLAQDGRLGEPGVDHRPGWLKHLRLCCSSHGCNWRWPLEKTSMKKKTFSFGHCPNYLKPPTTPIRATWSFFSDVKIQDLKVSLELRILYILYNILYICNLKNSLKFNTLAFLKK